MTSFIGDILSYTRLAALGLSNRVGELAIKACALHLRCHRLMEMRPARVMALIEDADLLRRPEQLEPLLQACEADYRGRKGFEDRPYPQAQKLTLALRAVLAVQARDLSTEGLSGREIGKLLREARVEAIRACDSDPAS